MVHDIDVALCEGDFSKLCQVFGIQERHFGMLLKGNADDSSCRADAIDQVYCALRLLSNIPKVH